MQSRSYLQEKKTERKKVREEGGDEGGGGVGVEEGLQRQKPKETLLKNQHKPLLGREPREAVQV